MVKEKQELHCHNCNNYVQFELELEEEGQHILTCPKCKHKHYRYIKDGKISDRRWGQDPSQRGAIYYVSGNITYSPSSSATTTTASNYFFYNSWDSTGSTW